MKTGNREMHTGRFGCFARWILLFLEILFLCFVLIGRDAAPDEALPTSDTVLPGTDTTPEFAWENYRTLIHALGGLEEKTYLNCKESFLSYYAKGCRLFEVDLTRTADGIWVCRHNWNDSMGQWNEEGKKILTEEEFLSAPLYGRYTPMSLKDLFLLLKEYPDAFVLVDSKQYSVRNYQKTIEDYGEYREIAKEADAESVLGQLIPEIYNEAMYPGIALVHHFPAYLYSLWQEYSLEEAERIAGFCQEKEISAVTVYEQYWTEEIQRILDRKSVV